ncbi:MAG: isoprenyl transferase [Lentisphaeria bacterium]|nr:isoprenyl transferase [Lentisphaeria bacterium]
MEPLPKPRHVAIIMDGNGRWAKKRGLPRTAGHKEGALAVDRITRAARELGIEYLTLYAFSTENWKRSKIEVSALMELLERYLVHETPRMQRENIRLKAIGRIDQLPASTAAKLRESIAATAGNTAQTLVLALNYGGRPEITDAARAIAQKVAAGELTPDQVDEACVANHMYAPDLPEVDLMIRTSGEMRLSNFLLWELAYAELYVTDVLWPDFDKEELCRALESFGRRERRFGAEEAK